MRWMAAKIAHYFPGYPMVSPCYNTLGGHMPWSLFRYLAEMVDVMECRQMALVNTAHYNAIALGNGFASESDRWTLQQNRMKWVEAGRLKHD